MTEAPRLSVYFESFADGEVDLVFDRLKIMQTAGPVDLAWRRRADALAIEVVGVGYSAGGKPRAGRSVEADVTDVVFGPVVWPDSTIQATGAIIFADRGSADADVPFVYFYFDGVVANTRGNLTIEPPPLRLYPPDAGPPAAAFREKLGTCLPPWREPSSERYAVARPIPGRRGGSPRATPDPRGGHRRRLPASR